MTRSNESDLALFEPHRRALVAHAYRMLGDLGRAEDMVQEAWLRWSGREAEVASPRAYLVTLVTRLCINELNSAKTRKEESRGDRLPEPVDLDEGGLGRAELMDQVSMAFLVVLQRLTPAERAVLLLREVFDFDYKEIAELVGKSGAACRKLLERARQNVSAEKRMFATPPETHRRMLEAFTQAAKSGDLDMLVSMLAEDAVMVTDGGPEGRRVEGIRNLHAPLQGAVNIASFIAATAGRAALETELHELNGRPALVFYSGNAPFAALLLGIADGRIERVFFHADAGKLRFLGPRTPSA
ncbi:MAG: sigma-70 family RNA polymerase sigma factor [Acidobacteria bacterium]|nr:sigma-70 family RNA polymerase sigma factor [Acidobacteriota bacterium]